MSLYLKYRPRTIEELDLASVRKTLGEMVSGNKLAHAYLFTGPRGAGKTSAARILARVINCDKNADKLHEPCNECDSCLSILSGSAIDVVEIDAASNRGIDDIRELKEKIRLSPALLRKKVYIIDEVHMLTTEAFNALLKTLEEPPDHAVFVLCTTESHKVPETIKSRCVSVNFTKATSEEMERSFRRVVSGEKALIDDNALHTIVAAVDGSFRDGVKILDTVLSLGRHVKLADAENAVYGSSGFSSIRLSTSLAEKNLEQSLQFFQQAVNEGVDITYILVAIMKDLRDGVLAHYGVSGISDSLRCDISVTQLITKLDDIARKISTSPVPALLVEMAIIEWCDDSSERGNLPKVKDPSRSKSMKKEDNLKKTTENRELQSEKISVKESITMSDVVPRGFVEISAEEAWQRLIASLNGDSYSLGALLSKARPGVLKGNVLTIEMQHSFHREQLMQSKFRMRVEKLISDVVGCPMLIECIVVPAHTLQSTSQVDSITQVAPEETELMEAAEEIFSANG